MPTFVISVNAAGALQTVNQLRGAVGQLADQFNRADGTLRNFEKGVSSFRRAVLGVQNILAGFGLAKMVQDLIKVNVEFEKVRLSLVAGNNSVEAAAADFAWVRAEAVKLGIPLSKVGLEYSKLAAAAKGTALQGQPVRDIFVSVAKASQAMGIEAASTQRIFMALTQMLSKGRVQAEEARQQFGEHLPGGFKALARAAGYDAVTGLGKFQQALTKGKVDAIAMLTNLPKILDEMFGPAFEASLMSPQRAMGMFKQAFDNMMYDLGQKGGFIREFVKLLRELTDVFQSEAGAAQIERFSQGLGNLMGVVREVTVFIAKHVQDVAAAFTTLFTGSALLGLKGFFGWMRKLAGGATLFSALLNPINLVISAIALATGALILFNDKIVKLGGYSANALDWMSTGFQLIGEKIAAAGQAFGVWLQKLPVIGPLFKTLSTEATNFFNQLKAWSAYGLNPGLIVSSFMGNFGTTLAPLLDTLNRFGEAVKRTFLQVGASIYTNVKSGLDKILGLFGSSLSNLPQDIAKWFGSDSFQGFMDGAKKAVTFVGNLFFGMIETIGVAFKLSADIFAVALEAVYPAIESIYSLLSQLGGSIKDGLAPSDEAMNAWGAFGEIVSIVYDTVAWVAGTTLGIVSEVVSIGSSIFDSLKYAFNGIFNLLGSIFNFIVRAVVDTYNLITGSSQDSMKTSGISWAKFGDIVLGIILTIIKGIGLMIDWIGAFTGTLLDLATRAMDVLGGLGAGLGGLLTHDQAKVDRAGKMLGDALTKPLENRLGIARKDTSEFLGNLGNDFSVFSRAIGTRDKTQAAFAQAKPKFAGAFSRFGNNQDNVSAGLADPNNGMYEAGVENAKQYSDGFFKEWANRATDLTSKKTTQKMMLEEEQRKQLEREQAAWQQQNDAIDRNNRPDTIPTHQNHHKSPADKAAELIAELRAQTGSDNALSAEVQVNPHTDASSIKAVKAAVAALRRSDYNSTFGDAMSGSAGEVAKKLASVAYTASLASQKLEDYQHAEEDIAKNDLAVRSFKDQIMMAQQSGITSSQLQDNLAAEQALRQSGLEVTLKEAQAVDALGGPMNNLAFTLAQSALAQEHWNRAAKAAIASVTELDKLQQTRNEFSLLAGVTVTSSAALDDFSAQIAAQKAVMALWGDQIFDVTRLLDPMTKAIYDQSYALEKAGGSAASYAKLTHSIGSDFLSTISPSRGGRAQQRDSLNAQGGQLDAGYALQTAGLNAQLTNPDAFGTTVDKVKGDLLKAADTYKVARAELDTLLLTQSDDIGDQALGNLIKIGESATDIAGQMGEAMSRAFDGMTDALTNFVLTGKLKFGDLARSIIQDITRMIVKWLAWQAIKAGANLLVPGSGSFLSALGFANGGIMTSGGSMNLRRYAGGGIASSPQLAMFGEGSRPEAYVPLPDGRSIPVTMSGGFGGAGGSSSDLMKSIASGTEAGVSSALRGSNDGGTRDVRITVDFAGAAPPAPTGDATQNAKYAAQLTKQMAVELRGMVVEVVQGELRPGGSLNPMGANRTRF